MNCMTPTSVIFVLEMFKQLPEFSLEFCTKMHNFSESDFLMHKTTGSSTTGYGYCRT